MIESVSKVINIDINSHMRSFINVLKAEFGPRRPIYVLGIL